MQQLLAGRRAGRQGAQTLTIDTNNTAPVPFSAAHAHPILRGMASAQFQGSPAVAACATPAYKAAEELLLSKLSGGYAECDIDYVSLEEANEEALNLHSYSDAEANREGNRYTDVLPYNYNRVRLRDVGRRGHDYLNASLVQSSPRDPVPWQYIVAQGPLDHTRDRFWQAVFEQRCSAIVMLTNCVERNITKCARYFPSQPATKKPFGRFTVKTAAAEEVSPDLVRRSLVVADGSTGHRHPLDHYHYAAWPDHGVPASPLPLLKICDQLLHTRAHSSPILVHCSAGIGRSGVFCVLDIVTWRLRQLQPDDVAGALKAVDLLALVGQLREQRMGMVQTRDQYVFCHYTLLEFLHQLDAQQQQQ